MAKPAGWLTTPAREKTDPRPCLGRELQTELGIQIFPVHRLDFEVSGLVLFAKNSHAHKVAQRWFEHGTVIKTYRAETAPSSAITPPEQWVEWKSKMLRGKRRAYISPQGKECVTRARVIATEGERWIWELQPLTGRPHQLRVELANHGCPILGDVLYGGLPLEENRIALHAFHLDFAHVSAEERSGLPQSIALG